MAVRSVGREEMTSAAGCCGKLCSLTRRGRPKGEEDATGGAFGVDKEGGKDDRLLVPPPLRAEWMEIGELEGEGLSGGCGCVM